MTGAVPPQIESPKTFIGVGARELVILGVCGLLGILSLFIPLHLAIRIGVAVLIAGLGLAMAFGRDRRSGKTLEAYLFDLFRFYTRKRFRQKGTDEEAPSSPRMRHALRVEAPLEPESMSAGMASSFEDARIRVKPLPLGPGLLFSILSFAFLASLLAWIWLGGLAEIQAWLGMRGF
jgi:hypothetical protein